MEGRNRSVIKGNFPSITERFLPTITEQIEVFCSVIEGRKCAVIEVICSVNEIPNLSVIEVFCSVIKRTILTSIAEQNVWLSR